jgi:sirohydrochlorin ferrochelatase
MQLGFYVPGLECLPIEYLPRSLARNKTAERFCDLSKHAHTDKESLMQKIVLVDNGSRRVEAVLNLNRLATELSEKSGRTIDAAPLQHADKIPPEAFGDALGGKAVNNFPEYVEEALGRGLDELLIIPLFFGHSRAISSFIPNTLNTLQPLQGTLNWSVADVLCPLPQGEPQLARLLFENLGMLENMPLKKLDFIILVDHGSPYKKVTDVRVKLAGQLSALLPENTPLLQAAMERREGSDYDFSGPLLKDLLKKLARENGILNVAISMLFISPGRHAGNGGDIAEICDQVMQQYPGLTVHISPLVGDNPLLTDLLLNRVQAML